MNAKMRIVIAGIKIKLARGENLEEILTTYKNLTQEEKQLVRDEIALSSVEEKK